MLFKIIEEFKKSDGPLDLNELDKNSSKATAKPSVLPFCVSTDIIAMAGATKTPIS